MRARVKVSRKPGRSVSITGGAVNKQVVLDRDRLDELLESYPNKSMSEIIRELIEERLEKIKNEKNVMGLPNPINISYDNHIKPPYIEPLDKYLEDHSVTTKHWFDFFSKIDSFDRVAKYEALAVTISKQAKQRVNYLKTGKYLVQ